MNQFPPGIFWDPREPPPPEIQRYLQVHSRRQLHDDCGSRGSPTVNFATTTSTTYRKTMSRTSPDEEESLPGGASAYCVDAAATTTINPAAPVPKLAPKLFPDLAIAVPGQAGEPELCVMLPLSIAIKARVVQDVAKITVIQLYFNNSLRAIEKGGYTFPLPNGCTVTSFSCRVGKNKTLRGAVKPKQEAKEAFDDATKRRLTAGLFDEVTPEIFTVLLGNIPAETKVKVELSFVMQLKRRFAVPGADNRSITTLTIPTSIAPRYGDVPHSSRLKLATTGVSRGLSVEVEIDTCEKVAHVSSPTHAITVERGTSRGKADAWEELTAASPAQAEADRAERVLVRLSLERTDLGGDFVLNIQTERGQGDEEVPQAVMEMHPTIDHQAAMMITLPPKLLCTSASDTKSNAHGLGEVVFLADRSGSMSDKMHSLMSAMQFFLKGIPPGRKFNVWCFGSSFTRLWPKSLDYTEVSLREALAFVSDSFRSDMGGTELLPAIEAIVAARDQSTYLDIIVLTDGEVWRQHETIEFIRVARNQSGDMVRLFALGVGDAVSHALVEGMATAGGGYSEIIPARRRDGWEDRVVAMTHAALTSHWGSVEIEIQPGLAKDESGGSDAGSELLPVLQSPPSLGAINLYQRGRIFLLFNAISGRMNCRYVVLKIASGPPDAIERVHVRVRIAFTRDDAIHTLAAKSVLEDMRLQPRADGPGSSGTASGLNRTLCEDLACRFSIASQWTSFLLSEEAGGEGGDDPGLAEGLVWAHGGAKTAFLTRKRTAFVPSSAGACTSSAVLSRLGASIAPLQHEQTDVRHAGDSAGSDSNPITVYSEPISRCTETNFEPPAITLGSPVEASPSIYFHHWKPPGAHPVLSRPSVPEEITLDSSSEYFHDNARSQSHPAMKISKSDGSSSSVSGMEVKTSGQEDGVASRTYIGESPDSLLSFRPSVGSVTFGRSFPQGIAHRNQSIIETALATEPSANRERGESRSDDRFACSARNELPDADDKKDFVCHLLQEQKFDGSFDFEGVWDEADSAFWSRYSRSIARLRRTCTDKERTSVPGTILGIPAKAAHALMVVVVLQTDYAEFESLWRLMAMKARRFAEKEAPDKRTRDRLESAWFIVLNSRGRWEEFERLWWTWPSVMADKGGSGEQHYVQHEAAGAGESGATQWPALGWEGDASAVIQKGRERHASRFLGRGKVQPDPAASGENAMLEGGKQPPKPPPPPSTEPQMAQANVTTPVTSRRFEIHIVPAEEVLP